MSFTGTGCLGSTLTDDWIAAVLLGDAAPAGYALGDPRPGFHARPSSWPSLATAITTLCDRLNSEWPREPAARRSNGLTIDGAGWGRLLSGKQEAIAFQVHFADDRFWPYLAPRAPRGEMGISVVPHNASLAEVQALKEKLSHRSNSNEIESDLVGFIREGHRTFDPFRTVRNTRWHCLLS